MKNVYDEIKNRKKKFTACLTSQQGLCAIKHITTVIAFKASMLETEPYSQPSPLYYNEMSCFV